MRGRWTRNEMPTGHRPKSEREKRKRNPKENGEIKTSHRTRKIENKRTGHVPSLWPHWPPFTGLFFFYLPSFVRSGSLFWVGWSSFGTSVACRFYCVIIIFLPSFSFRRPSTRPGIPVLFDKEMEPPGTHKRTSSLERFRESFHLGS